MKYLITILSMACLYVQGMAQGNKPLVDIKYEGRGASDAKIEKIVFRNSEGIAILEFDPKANNPFENVRSQGQVINQDKGGDKVQVQGCKVQDFIPNTTKFKKSEAASKDVFFVETPFNAVEDGNKNLVGITYKLRLLDENYQRDRFNSPSSNI